MKYQKTSADNPTLIILAVDRSSSMTNGFISVENKHMSSLEVGAQIANKVLDNIIEMSYTDELIRNRYVCAVFGYKFQNEDIQIKVLLPPSFSAELPDKIDFEKEDVSPTVPLSSLISFAEKWAKQNTNSLPPVIINIANNSTRSSSTFLNQFQTVRANDNSTSLIFNCFIDKLPEVTIKSGTFQDLLEGSSLLPREFPFHEIPETRKELEQLQKGAKIGNYFINQKIGAGGIGNVYKAQHYLLNQTVAIKVLERMPNDPIISTTFLQAANYLSQLNHPNIVALLDYGLLPDRAYMAMEYVEGTTLDKLIPKTPSETWTKRTLLIFVQLLSALRYAHSCIYRNLGGAQVQGIIHGDIKPANILINSGSDFIKLADFMIPDIQQYLTHENIELRKLLLPLGIPFTDEEKQNLIDRIMPASTAFFGSPKYMPPEQWEGKVSVQGDIFCLGATLYELLTGLPPMSLFKGSQPRYINPFIPEWIESCIIKCMKIEPSERYSTVAEIETIFRENLSKNHNTSLYIKELVMGDKISFNNTGTVNNSGQLFIGRFNDIYAHLNSSGNTELAEVLKTLKEAIMASKELSDSQKEENIEVVNKLGDEALKAKPNKTLMKSLGEGLLSTLKNIPDIAKAIAAVAPFITGVK